MTIQHELSRECRYINHPYHQDLISEKAFIRAESFPDLPTVAEAALPGYEAVLHYGIVAPSGTPGSIVAKLNAALNAALADREVRGRILADGAEPLPGSPEDYAADIDREETKWSRIVKLSGAKVNE